MPGATSTQTQRFDDRTPGNTARICVLAVGWSLRRSANGNLSLVPCLSIVVHSTPSRKKHV